jgi:hypothetical protein
MILKGYFFTYDHRTLKTRLPVRSALFKQRTGGLVVRWVTTSEYPLLYVFASFATLTSSIIRVVAIWHLFAGMTLGWVAYPALSVLFRRAWVKKDTRTPIKSLNIGSADLRIYAACRAVRILLKLCAEVHKVCPQ